jgi:hypothetical protein
MLLRSLQTVGAVSLMLLLAACNDETDSTTNDASGDNDTKGSYELIHAVIRTSQLPETSASRYEIEQERDSLLLTLVIKDKATGNNVPAEIEVEVVNAAGQRMELEVDELVANDKVSYVGILDVVLPAFLDFQVRYRPQGESDMVDLDFREDFKHLKPQ